MNFLEISRLALNCRCIHQQCSFVSHPQQDEEFLYWSIGGSSITGIPSHVRSENFSLVTIPFTYHIKYRTYFVNILRILHINPYILLYTLYNRTLNRILVLEATIGLLQSIAALTFLTFKINLLFRKAHTNKVIKYWENVSNNLGFVHVIKYYYHKVNLIYLVVPNECGR